jgi:crotonobetainyl-CoA:carnitine CoA-transferase CaiB-like acyl-CoA transferase
MNDEMTANGPWSGPLQGIKVLDFTRILAGPFATQILGDLGAEILKVEPPGHGDETRTYAPFRDGESHYFIAINRSKKSMVVDLKNPAGHAVIVDLIRKVDVVIENFRPGVMEKLGLGYQTLAEINPRLVYCAISGFGLTGPLRDTPSFDIVTQALTGAMSVNGEPGRSPVKLGLPLGDMVGGVFAPVAILAALLERGGTGRGRLVDISLYDGLIGMLGYLPQLHFFSGQEPQTTGSSHPHIVPYGAYQAKDGPILIACLTQSFWLKLTEAIGRPELAADPDNATMADRVRNRDVIDAIIAETIARRSVDEWKAILEDCDVPHAPVLKIGEALAQPQAVAREMVATTCHSRLGPIRVTGRPIKFPGDTQPELAPPPVLGEHTAEILKNELGYSDERITELQRTGALGRAEG